MAWTHGIPDDPKERAQIRGRLNAAELAQFDLIVAKVDAGRMPNKDEARFLRQLQGLGKLPRPGKKFRSASDMKTHQDP